MRIYAYQLLKLSSSFVTHLHYFYFICQENLRESVFKIQKHSMLFLDYLLTCNKRCQNLADIQEWALWWISGCQRGIHTQRSPRAIQEGRQKFCLGVRLRQGVLDLGHLWLISPKDWSCNILSLILTLLGHLEKSDVKCFLDLSI